MREWRARVDIRVAGQRDQARRRGAGSAQRSRRSSAVCAALGYRRTTSPGTTMPMSPCTASAGCRNRRRSRAAEGRGDLGSDQARLAHPRHHHPALQACRRSTAEPERLAQARNQVQDGAGLQSSTGGRSHRASGVRTTAWIARTWRRSGPTASRGSELGPSLFAAPGSSCTSQNRSVDSHRGRGPGQEGDERASRRSGLQAPRVLDGCVASMMTGQPDSFIRRGPEIDDQVLVAERRAPLRDQDRSFPAERTCRRRGASPTGENCPFLMFHRPARSAGGDQEVGLAAEKRRDLQGYRGPRRPLGLGRLVDVGQHGTFTFRLDLLHIRNLRRPGAEGPGRAAVRLSKEDLKMNGTPASAAIPARARASPGRAARSR